MDSFRIRSYSKAELAMCYFPTTPNPHTAVNHLMSWIKRCTPLYGSLVRHGYTNTSKWFSPRQVRLIVEYLGEP